MTENLIAESMYSACDDYGNLYLMMDSIVEYRNIDKAVPVSRQKLVHRGWGFIWQPTVGWQLCVQWRYGSTSWQALKDLKESNTVETEDYAVAQ